MLIKKISSILPSELTKKKLCINRRQFIVGSVFLSGASILSSRLLLASGSQSERQIKAVKRGDFTVPEKLTPYEEATSYTNFYEFSTGKRSVKQLSQDFRVRPWAVLVEGHCEKPGSYAVDELINMFPLEERIYRWRCVEA